MAAFDTYKSQISELAGKAMEYISALRDNIKEQVYTPVVTWIEEVTGGLASQTWMAVMNYFLELYQTISTTLAE